MKYEVIRTDTADAGIRKIILYIAQNFGNTVATGAIVFWRNKICPYYMFFGIYVSRYFNVLYMACNSKWYIFRW